MDFDILSGKLLKILQGFPEIHLGIVFGSFASGTATPQSDIDLAVAANGPLTSERKIELMNAVSVALGRETDLVDLTTATGTVFKQALSHGRVILKKDPVKLARILSRLVYEEENFQKMRRKLMAKRRKAAFDVA